MLECAYSKKALTFLKRVSANEQRRIRAKIVDYAANPSARGHHVKRLRGREGYRLRVGGWRVIFEVNGNVLEILDIGARGSVYD